MKRRIKETVLSWIWFTLKQDGKSTGIRLVHKYSDHNETHITFTYNTKPYRIEIKEV